jgi:hypothetical protein
MTTIQLKYCCKRQTTPITKEPQVREVTHIIDSGQENKTDADLSEDSFHSMYWHFELKIYEKSTNITLVSLYSKYNRGLHKRMGVVCLLQQYLSCIVAYFISKRGLTSEISQIWNTIFYI